MRVGIIGCGTMGKGIAQNFIDNNWDVYVYDTNKKVENWIESKNGKFCDSIQEICEHSLDIYVTSLPSVSVLESTYLGDEGILKMNDVPSVFIDLSTADIELTKGIYNYAKKNGHIFFDCPVSGGPEGAESGALTLMVGGDEELFKKYKNIFEVMGEDIFYMGDPGMGQATKLANNMIVAASVVGIADATKFAEKVGLEKNVFREVIASGSASRVFSVFGDKLIDEDFEAILFSLNNMLKDVSLYNYVKDKSNIPQLNSENVLGIYKRAKQEGYGNFDHTSIFKLM